MVPVEEADNLRYLRVESLLANEMANSAVVAPLELTDRARKRLSSRRSPEDQFQFHEIERRLAQQSGLPAVRLVAAKSSHKAVPDDALLRPHISSDDTMRERRRTPVSATRFIVDSPASSLSASSAAADPSPPRGVPRSLPPLERRDATSVPVDLDSAMAREVLLGAEHDLLPQQSPADAVAANGSEQASSMAESQAAASLPGVAQAS